MKRHPPKDSKVFQHGLEVVARLGYDVQCLVGFDNAHHLPSDAIVLALDIRVTCMKCSHQVSYNCNRRDLVRTVMLMRRRARWHKKSGACERNVDRHQEEVAASWRMLTRSVNKLNHLSFK